MNWIEWSIAIIVIIVGAVISAKLIKDIIEEDRKQAEIMAEMERRELEAKKQFLEMEKSIREKQREIEQMQKEIDRMQREID